MGALSLGYRVIVDSPVRAFGFQKTPPYVRSVFPSQLTSLTGYTASGLKIIPECNALILEPFPLWQPLTLSLASFPNGGTSDWSLATSSETGQSSLLMGNATPNADGSPHQYLMQTQGDLLVPSSSSFYVRLSRGQPVSAVPVGSPSGTPPVPFTADNDYCVFQVGDGNDGLTPFRLVFQRGRAVFLQQSNPDGSWGDYGENGVFGSVADSNSLWENTRALEIQWLVLPQANTLRVSIGNGQEKIVFQSGAYSLADNSATYGNSGIAGQATPQISISGGALTFYGSGGTAGFEYGSMVFSESGYLLSPTIDLPFVYQGNGSVIPQVSPLIDSLSVQTGLGASDNSGTRVQWALQLQGPPIGGGYTDISPIVSQVELSIPPTFDYTATIGVPSDISEYVSEIDESSSLSWIDSVSSQVPVIRCQAGLTLDNSSGGFTGYGGVHRAVQYSRWLNIQSPVTGLMEQYSPEQIFLTGWCGFDDSVYKADPHRKFDLVLEDGAWPMTQADIGYMDPVDGWCPLAAMRFLAQLSGRNDSFISDAMKTCGYGPDPAGCPHVKLPIGSGATPKMGFGPNVKYWDALAEICSYYHAILFVDPYNSLGAVDYEGAVMNAPYAGQFGLSESGNPALSDFLSSMWRSQTIEASTKDRRTGVAFFGIDPGVNEVQGTYLDADDFLGEGWTANVHGFRQPLIAVSNLFTDPAFTAYFALRALSRITLPTLSIENGACFLPNMFPLTAYSVAASLGGLSTPAIMILETIRSRFSAIDPSQFGSTVQGRYFANLI